MSINLVDPELDLIDPIPDIYEHFNRYNNLIFNNKLGGCEVKWSKRMTLCAGNCRYIPRSGECIISLSEPLLKLRPRCDFVNTLLHEMIHAYLFVTKNNRDRDGHGPEFQSWMNKINKICGTSVTIYHTFNAEVRHYKTHVWRCNGPCSRRPPFWGYIRRSMNRAPSKNDYWWSQHEATCGGKFIKIKEPDNYRKNVVSKTNSCQNNVPKKMTIVNGILVSAKESPKKLSPSNKGDVTNVGDIKPILKYTGNIIRPNNGINRQNKNGSRTITPKSIPSSSNRIIKQRNVTNSKESQKIIKPNKSSDKIILPKNQNSLDSFVIRTPKKWDISRQENIKSPKKCCEDIIYLGTLPKGKKLGTAPSKSPSFLKKLHQERLERMKKF
ncbi:Domain of unknown function SprT-like domain-containing protein [Strongyloides ratti]|uniref:SprT-like domain-containing protein n=1 Tax=Strongyloides ratti TaxID=34506 RepID=A0A090N044_STRRB|nr:Domain of unknown function SprT-like domain-containing protein [Strongyloides ratti]CEF70040.1 Domain of unknown function SprT-like domain-containing protein [Strongyloides ratti]